ncbi:MAG: ABC transporter substrate-binding protein [Theionarchaea archaeon]|nr:MAG: hypothetical protein AYK18_03050 [Theionarchaea archaeon DG-70]MBU7012205.1 ABC transporter substrate-binding protein [Theionarchaea archaeon]
MTREWISKKTRLFAVCLLAMLISAGLSPQTGSVTNPANDVPEEHLLKIGCLHEPGNLNVWSALSGWTWQVIGWFYPALYYRKPVTLEPLPDICAISFSELKEASPDGLTFTFPLREDVRWDDGESLTAHDFEFTYGVVNELEIPSYLPQYEDVEYFRAIDDYTLEIKLKKCTPQFEESIIYMFVAPKHQFEPMLMKARRTDDPLHTFMNMPVETPVSAGPFSFGGMEKESSIKLVTNPYYHGKGRTVEVPEVGKITEGPYYDGLLLKFYTGSEEAMKGMMQGDIDYFWRYVDPAYVIALHDEQVITIEKTDSLGLCALVPKVRNPPFDDVVLRQALVYMIDKTFIVHNGLLGYATEAHSVVVPAAGEWYCDEVNKFGHGLSKDERKTKAIALLTEAGYVVPDAKYPDGILKLPSGQDMEPFRIFTGPVEYNPQRVMCGLLIQEWWRELGVPVSAEPTPLEKFFHFDWNIFGWDFGSSPYPDYMRNLFHSDQAGPYGKNLNGYHNVQVDKYLEELVTLCDQEDLLRASWEAQKLIIDEVAYCPLFCTPQIEAHRNDTFEGWFTQLGGIAGDQSPTFCLLYLRPIEKKKEGTLEKDLSREEIKAKEEKEEEKKEEEKEETPCLGSVFLICMLALSAVKKIQNRT